MTVTRCGCVLNVCVCRLRFDGDVSTVMFRRLRETVCYELGETISKDDPVGAALDVPSEVSQRLVTHLARDVCAAVTQSGCVFIGYFLRLCSDG